MLKRALSAHGNKQKGHFQRVEISKKDTFKL